MLKAKFAVLHEMLNTRPWLQFNLTVHMFHRERRAASPMHLIFICRTRIS